MILFTGVIINPLVFQTLGQITPDRYVPNRGWGGGGWGGGGADVIFG
jgi:hypothetical protein